MQHPPPLPKGRTSLGRDSMLSSHQSAKLRTLQKNLRPSSIVRQLQTLQPQPPLAKPPSAFSQAGGGRGLDDHFLFMRKENHLNTCFNIRKKRLKEMTRANKQIFHKISSQKSNYSSSDMNKSYQSIKEIKDRLSQSKLSQRSLSRQSSRKSLASKPGLGFQKRKEQPLQLKACNIHRAAPQDVSHFKTLFHKEALTRERTIENSEEMVRHNSYRKNGPYIRSVKVSARKSLHCTREARQAKARSDEGGLLHRIIEEFKEDRPTGVKKTR
jgi:hypothetical protein